MNTQRQFAKDVNQVAETNPKKDVTWIVIVLLILATGVAHAAAPLTS